MCMVSFVVLDVYGIKAFDICVLWVYVVYIAFILRVYFDILQYIV